MKKHSVLIFLLFFSANLFCQTKEVLKLTSVEVEAIFLKQNLQLLAEQMNISLADAEIVQAKLWDNPTLTIGDINLWSTKSQREGESEVIPPLFGSFAKNTQFSIELSQLIQTANKRRKLVAREKISKEIAIQQFEVTLRGLRTELRKSINEIIYYQNYLKTLAVQQKSIRELVNTYQKQVSQGNIAKSELLRLQSSLLEMENENNEITEEFNEQLRVLKTLLSIDPLGEIEIIDNEANIKAPNSILLPQLLEQVTEHSLDVKLSKLQTQYFQKSIVYEKSQRIPDITLNANYDRYGGVWKNFIGFGVSIDLPLFNRNQGAIKTAQLNYEQSKLQENQQINQTQHEIVEAYANYSQAYKFYEKINNNDLFSDLDNTLSIYSKNLLNRNISMLEYIDFMETYKTNKQIVLMARKNMLTQFEELQYIVGTELNNTTL